MIIFFFLLACESFPYDAWDTGEIFCVDERGYEHEVGVWWQCADSCASCSCGEDGKIFKDDSGPVIRTEDCLKELSPDS
jgi:hypothetical protein